VFDGEGSLKNSKPIELSKLEVAKRQLVTAVSLYFSNADEVSTHTLAAASYNVLRDLSVKKNLGPMIVKDLLIQYAKPEAKELVKKAFNQAENFFKHADKDPDKTLEFLPIKTEYLIFDAETRYQIIAGEVLPVLLTYRAWFILNHKNVFNFPDEELKVIDGWPSELASRGRLEFFKETFSLAEIAAAAMTKTKGLDF
jgi:hypothetical protein